MNTVTVAIESGALFVDDGVFHVGELAPLAFTGYAPAEGNSIRLTLFDRDGKTPLADNHEDAETLDLRGEKLRRAFHGARASLVFQAVATEVTALGESTGEVLATGQVPVAWSPLVFDAETGEPASLKGETGQNGRDGRDGRDGQDGKDLAWGDMTSEQQAALVAAVAEVLATNPDYAAALRGLQGLPGTPGVGLPGKDGKDGKDGQDGNDGKDGKDGNDFSWGDMTSEQQAALVAAVAEVLVNNPTYAAALKGMPGERGIQGLQGLPGTPGVGQPGKDGKDGKDGQDGNDGKSAYEIAVEHGYEGTEEDWIGELADKSFVNSSIATNTANYISDGGRPFESLAALQAYSGTKTNNDYAFVVGTDQHGNTTYTRYKYVDPSGWAEEYVLNNSSFTAAQWAAISSGITGAAVEKLSGIAAGAQVNVVETVKVNGTALTPENKAVNVTVPAISTSIYADAASNTKAVSPKAVKTFVEGKGYLLPSAISGKMNLPPIVDGWQLYGLGTQETMEVPGWPLPAVWFPMRLRYTPDESDPDFIVQAELEIDEFGSQPIWTDFEYMNDVTSWGIFYGGDFTVVSKGNSVYEVGDNWYPDGGVLASYLNIDGTLRGAYGATLVSTAGGVESPVPADVVPAQTVYYADLYAGRTTVLTDSWVGGSGFPRQLLIGIFDFSYGSDVGHFNPDGTYRLGDLCYGPPGSSYEWVLCICITEYDRSLYPDGFDFPGGCFGAVRCDTRLVLAHVEPGTSVRAPDLGWNDPVAVHSTDVDDLRAGTYDMGTGEYLLGDPSSVNVFDIDQLTDPNDAMFGRSFTVTKKVYQRPELPGYDPSLEV